MAKRGIIYIFTNDSLKENIIKVGKTTTNIQQRLRELDTTGVAVPFRCYFAIQVDDVDFAEDKIHALFSETRLRDRREFFQISPEAVKMALKGLYPNGKDVTIDNSMVDENGERTNENLVISRRRKFSFERLGIPVGSKLIFTRNPSKTCIVINGDNAVEYEGKEFTLTSLARYLDKHLQDIWERNNNGGIQGTLYWKYNGKTINELNIQANEEE